MGPSRSQGGESADAPAPDGESRGPSSTALRAVGDGTLSPEPPPLACEPVPEMTVAQPSTTDEATLSAPAPSATTAGGAGVDTSADAPAVARAPDDRGDTIPAVATAAAPGPEDDVASARGVDAAGSGGDDLEELLLPSSIQAPIPLPVGAEVGPDGLVRIERFIAAHGRLNRYSATVRQGGGPPVPCELREAPDDQPDLRREGEVLAEVSYTMLPRPLVSFEQDGRRYLAVERHDERVTLAEALEPGIDVARAISIVVQLTQVLRRLHAGGWALLGLQPAHIALGDPLQITQLGTAARIGQEAGRTLSVPGYSAPELAHRALVTGKEDVYTLGALLYRVLVGAPVPEQGPELAALGTLVRLPGAPQLLDAALVPIDERCDLESFYRRLLAFKGHWSRRALALELASGTTVGLNRTRPVNEDAHACVTWSVAHDARIAYRALLCVVDGMGGMEAGEVASRAAVDAILDGVAGGVGFAPPPPEPVALVRAAARAVYDAAAGRAVGATITCAVLDDGSLTLAHVGDTRAYLLRDGVLTQLTHDHSLVAAMVASGVLSASEARGHPDSNKVLRSLGGQRDLEDAYIDTLAVTRGTAVLDLLEDDRLLLCSDGVWGSLDDETLRASLRAEEGCATIVQAILRRVLDGGAPDNATLVVARCHALPTS